MPFDFENNGTVTELAAVPDAYKGLFEEGTNEAGETVHKVAGFAKGLVADHLSSVKVITDLRAEKKTVTDENAKRRIAGKVVDDWAQTLGLEVGDDGPVPALTTFVTDLQSSVKNGKEVSINLDKIKADFDGRMTTAIAAKDAEIVDLNTVISKTLISDAATLALSNAKGSIELLLPHVERQCKVVRNDTGAFSVQVLDAQGDARLDANGSFMGVLALVEEMKGQEKFARGFDSGVKPGTGVTPGALSRPRQRQEGTEKSSVSKIADGLAARQRTAARA